MNTKYVTIVPILWLFSCFPKIYGSYINKGGNDNCISTSLSTSEQDSIRELTENITEFLNDRSQSKIADVDGSQLNEYLSQIESLLKDVQEIALNINNNLVQNKLQDAQSFSIDGDHEEFSNNTMIRKRSVSRSDFWKPVINPKFKYLLLNDAPDNLNDGNKGLHRQFQNDFPITTNIQRPADCAELLITGVKKSGVYTIYPFRCFCSPGIQVFCDMESRGGGWTVILNREKQATQEKFARPWGDYKEGFGTPSNEYWLGNEALHLLTSAREYTLRVYAVSPDEWSIWGEWSLFKVDSETKKYKLTISGYDGNSIMYDRFTYLNGLSFSTEDADHDKETKKNCATTLGGGFWYSKCSYHDPTATYGKIKIEPWSKTDATKRFASRLQMSIRPKICGDKASVAYFNNHNCDNPSF